MPTRWSGKELLLLHFPTGMLTGDQRSCDAQVVRGACGVLQALASNADMWNTNDAMPECQAAIASLGGA